MLSFHLSPAGRIVLLAPQVDDDAPAVFGVWIAEADGSGATRILESGTRAPLTSSTRVPSIV